MSTRIAPRHRRRIPCALSAHGSRRPAMVLNVSRSGLFVQTTMRPRRGEPVELELELPDGSRSVGIMADVVWRSVVASRFASIDAGGLGLRITRAPEAFHRFVDRLARGPGPQAGDALPPPRFRVRLRQRGGARTRWVAVDASGEDAARRAALDSAGRGWEVIELRQPGGEESA